MKPLGMPYRMTLYPPRSYDVCVSLRPVTVLQRQSCEDALEFALRCSAVGATLGGWTLEGDAPPRDMLLPIEGEDFEE